MSFSERTPVVPLEAGAGPENPPCPACGEPLFGWLAPRPGERDAVRRCESCGLGVVGLDADPAEALKALDGLARDGEVRIENRSSFACSLGGAGWSGLGPGARYLFTVEAVRRLVASRDQLVTASRWSAGDGFAATWQTLLNSVTFGHNVALGAFGRAPAAKAERPWQRRIDALASVVLAIPAALIAIPIELAGAAAGKGAVIALRFTVL